MAALGNGTFRHVYFPLATHRPSDPIPFLIEDEIRRYGVLDRHKHDNGGILAEQA
ncbi:MAG: hypothetical protein R8K48_08730 [Gallionella sp.]